MQCFLIRAILDHLSNEGFFYDCLGVIETKRSFDEKTKQEELHLIRFCLLFFFFYHKEEIVFVLSRVVAIVLLILLL